MADISVTISQIYEENKWVYLLSLLSSVFYQALPAFLKPQEATFLSYIDFQ